MAKAKFVKKARRDYLSRSGKIIIKKGESYFWWQFPFENDKEGKAIKHRSRREPKKSQLTKSEYYSRAFEIEESLMMCWNMPLDDLIKIRESALQEIIELRDQQRENLLNMPKSLQKSPTGDKLARRYDFLDEWHDQLDKIQIDERDDADDLAEKLNNTLFNG